jgi:Fe-S-cluster containining protein
MRTVDGIPFECTQCGDCCRWEGEVFLTPKDIGKISEALNISPSEFLEKSTISGKTLKNKPHSTECVFLEDNKCTIFSSKPEQCDRFPVKYTKKCPGFMKDRSSSMHDYAAAIKMVSEKLAQSGDYSKNVLDNLYKDLNTPVKPSSVTTMALEAGIDSFLNDSTVKVASLEDLFSFDRVDKAHLIHKATKDLWTIDADKSGNVQITRLFDNSGEPIKG